MKSCGTQELQIETGPVNPTTESTLAGRRHLRAAKPKPKENAWATNKSKMKTEYSPATGSRKGNENRKLNGKDEICPLETEHKK
jgi:hypothetical protein